jgi:hypothetical protein
VVTVDVSDDECRVPGAIVAAYPNVRYFSTLFEHVGFEPEPVPAGLKLAIYQGFPEAY